jgi:hypothetical protein
MAENDRHMHEPLLSPESGEADIRTKALVGAVAAFGVLVVVAGIGTWFLVKDWADTGPLPKPPARPLPIVGPVLQLSPTRDLAALRAREDKLLQGTEWIDRDKGLARIPIEKAMELLAKRAGHAPELSKGSGTKTFITPPSPQPSPARRGG